ncbi:MAG TPA: hypothetical protein VHO94_02125 [Oscillospiraceae bacterium]|nr:hypothetical protein [Oscillospiraceae bacterium]
MNPFPVIPHFRKIPKKLLLLSSGTVIFVALAVGFTLAFMTAHTNTVTNKFTPGVANIVVSEPNGSSYTISSNNTVDKIVAITNPNSSPVSGRNPVPVYVRVRLVPVMRYSSGAATESAIGTGEPVSVDYPDWNSNKWVKVNDYYYYKEILPPGKTTDYLIKTAVIKDGLKNGRKLEIQVIADSIQTVSDDELIKTWGIPFNGGKWIK